MFDFQSLALSGYVLCYGPLALVILGFIAFAMITDAQARSVYLRRLDTRPEAERVDEGPVPVNQSMRVMTPSGASVDLLQDAPPMVAPVRTAVVEVAAVDDIELIEGIGPKIKSVLAEAGMTTFAQLAGMSAEALRKILNDAGMSAIHDTSTWPEQAALAAAGNWDALGELQNNLRGGRRE
jgi:predicted flap endonuclease-1-like 5' DNA nuclease